MFHLLKFRFLKRDNSLLNYCNILDKLLQADILCKQIKTKNNSRLKKENIHYKKKINLAKTL